MSYPLRKAGLQVDSAISMGNSLYAIMVGVIISVIVVVLSSSAPKKALFGGNVFGIDAFLWKACMVVITGCWIAYYLYDWHDLNLVVIYDKKVAMKEMLTYFFCIFSISLCVVLTLLGKIVMLAIIESIYSPMVALFRNKLIDAPPAAPGATNSEIYRHGKAVMWDTIITWLLNIVFCISCFSCFVSALVKIKEVKVLPFVAGMGDIPSQIMLFLAVVVALLALCSKRSRSKHKIQREYKLAIDTTIREHQRRCHEVIDTLGRN